MNPDTNDAGRQVTAILAMLCLVLAAVAIGGGNGHTDRGVPTPTTWLADVESGADHVDATDLLRELLAARGDVALVDLRPADEFAAWHLPGAKNLKVPEVCGAAGEAVFAANPRRVVLCSNGPAHPGQAWVELRRAGRTNVAVLAGGLDELKARLLTPPSLRDGTSESRARSELAGWPMVRAFCLGNPAPSALATWATDPTTLSQPTMVSPRWLHEHLGQVAVLDLRSEAEFLAWHVPGAQRLDLAKIRIHVGDRDHLLVEDQALATWFGNLGIGNDTAVVLTADDKLHDTTMGAMALLRLGHRKLAILEGGMLRWATERRPLTPDLVMPTAVRYEPKAGGDDFTITADALAAEVAQTSRKVLDVRPADFFRGDKSTEARPGHVPGAVNRTFSKDAQRTPDGLWLRPRAELGKAYADLALQPDDAIAVSCRTGHQASQTFFVLRYLLGYRNVKWYAGSWTEWAARKDLPAVTGDK